MIGKLIVAGVVGSVAYQWYKKKQPKVEIEEMVYPPLPENYYAHIKSKQRYNKRKKLLEKTK